MAHTVYSVSHIHLYTQSAYADSNSDSELFTCKCCTNHVLHVDTIFRHVIVLHGLYKIHVDNYT